LPCEGVLIERSSVGHDDASAPDLDSARVSDVAAVAVVATTSHDNAAAHDRHLVPHRIPDCLITGARSLEVFETTRRRKHKTVADLRESLDLHEPRPEVAACHLDDEV